jgi:hypothetical protein
MQISKWLTIFEKNIRDYVRLISNKSLSCSLYIFLDGMKQQSNQSHKVVHLESWMPGAILSKNKDGKRFTVISYCGYGSGHHCYLPCDQAIYQSEIVGQLSFVTILIWSYPLNCLEVHQAILYKWLIVTNARYHTQGFRMSVMTNRFEIFVTNTEKAPLGMTTFLSVLTVQKSSIWTSWFGMF